MRQVLRLMGMPDRVIAFDELPADLLEGLEMHDESKMPRHWKDFFGTRTKHIKVQPYFDPFTRQRVECAPLIQTGPFSWLIDWEVNNNKERWQEIANFVRRNTPKNFRLMDKIEDMAKPLAPNAQEAVTLEPEEVIVIPIVLDAEAMEPETANVTIAPPETATASVATVSIATAETSGETILVTKKNPVCEVCGKKFKDGRGMRFHMKKHEKVPAAA